MNLWVDFDLKFDPILQGEMAKKSPKIHKIEIWPKSGPKVINSPNQSHMGTIFGECSNYKSGLRILIWPLEVPFFFGPKMGTFGKKSVKMGHPTEEPYSGH